MAALEISPIKIGYVIVKAREVAAKVAAWDDGATAEEIIIYAGLLRQVKQPKKDS